MSNNQYQDEVNAICGDKSDKVTVFIVKTLLKIDREGCAKVADCKTPPAQQNTSSSLLGSLSWGKMKASGIAIFVVGMLLAFCGGGWVAVKIVEVMKPIPRPYATMQPTVPSNGSKTP